MLKCHRLFILGLLASSALALSLGLTACGSGDKTVATVGKTKVSQATLSHWMLTTLGGDYLSALNKRAPLGLVSDPVDYPRCVSVAAQVVPQVGGKPKLSGAQLRLKCRQLNTAVREQALSYVLSVLWRSEEGAELGASVSEAQLAKKLREIIYEEYRTPAQFNKVLANYRRTVADVRFLLKRNLLQSKYLARLKAREAKLGGHRAFTKLVLEDNAKWTSKTSCSPGYLAWECKQYGSSAGASPSAAVVIEDLSKGVG